MRKVFRKEKKFLLTVEEAMKKCHQLDKVLMQDKYNNGERGYCVRSLYFDYRIFAFCQ